VALPAAWGAAIARVFGFVERRRRRSQLERGAGDPPPIDYSI
jgi:hypothetical protein